MRNRILKLTGYCLLILSLNGFLSGCVGSNVATSKILQFNLEVVENKYARGGVNVLLAPVYALTVAVDLLVFNSIEFWTGESPLNGEKHIFGSNNTTTYNVKNNLHKTSDKLLLKPETNNQVKKEVYSVQATFINENTVDYHIVYNNGDRATLRGDKSGAEVTFYLDGQFVTRASINELQAYLITP